MRNVFSLFRKREAFDQKRGVAPKGERNRNLRAAPHSASGEGYERHLYWGKKNRRGGSSAGPARGKKKKKSTAKP